MIYYILLACSIVLAVVKSAFVKRYSQDKAHQTSRIFFFNLVVYGLAAVLQLCITGLPTFAFATVLPAAGYALCCYLMQLFLMKSMAIGSMALSSLFCMYGMLLPTVAGPLFFKEDFSVWQGVGVALMLLAIFFSVDIRKGENTGKTWLLFALLTLVFSGMVGVFEKVHQSGPTKADISSFLSIAFLLIALLNAVTLYPVRRKETAPAHFESGLWIAALTGLIVIFYSRINLTLAGALDTMLYYPVSNGGAVLLTLIVSVTIFREPLRRNHILCFIFGTSAILLLGMA